MRYLVFTILGIVVFLVLIAGIVAAIGASLPRTHVASRSILLHRSTPDVYAVVRNLESAPTWRTDLERIEIETGAGGPLHFREVGKNGEARNYELTEDVPEERMVTRILDTDLGFSGQWTYSFAPEQGSTRLTIREDGEVSNVIFRFVSYYFMGHTATIDSYLTALARHFGEEAKPQ